VSLDGSLYLRNRLPGLPLRQISNLVRSGSAFHQSLHHQLPREPEHVCEDIADLDVGVFQDRLHPIAFLGPGSYQLLSSPRRFPQLANLEGRDVTWPDPSVPQQVRQPATVIRVRFVAPQVAHLLGIGEHHLQSFHFFQDMEDRFPIDAGALHGNMSTTAGL
jgi:hypothetical protein